MALPVKAKSIPLVKRTPVKSNVRLVLVFLNILPHSKHFHIITAVPNVFLGDLTPRGRLRPLAENTEKLMAAVEKATEGEDLLAARIGYARINHFSWKDVLDFYTCTECGRCSDNCPALATGKPLDPQKIVLDIRDQLLREGPRLLSATATTDGASANGGAQAGPTPRERCPRRSR